MDSTTASSLQIMVLDIFPGDNYTVPNIPLLELSDQLEGDTRVITYNGTEQIDVYMNLLTSIEFSNSLDEPRIGERRVTIQLFAPTDVLGNYLASNIVEVVIDVYPLNDNNPIFSQDLYNGSVVENSSAGTITGVIVMATDSDIYGSTSITYELMQPTSDFFIDPVSGIILTNRHLDAEVTPFYSLTVVASDNDGPLIRSSSANVHIDIIDLNDNSPVFNQSSYTASISENIKLQSVVLQVAAEDQDISVTNSYIRYEIIPPTQGSGVPTNSLPENPLDLIADIPFVINPVTGEISLSETLDYETTRQFSFTIQASDSGSPTLTGTTQVTVLVEDANDNAPQFINSPYSLILNESELYPNVLTVSAIDLDSGTNGEVRYYHTGTEQFSIDAATGVISIIMPLDYEFEQSLNFTVVASDSGFPPHFSEEHIVVTVLNINDNSPQFTEDFYVFSIPENSPLNVDVFASDDDLDQVTFLPTYGFSPYFDIDFFTGVITILPGYSLDYEMVAQFELIVGATDGLFTSFVNVTINVLDQNDLEPAFVLTSYMTVISESLPVGTSILQVRAEDGDTGSNAEVEYILDSGEDSVPFMVNSQTGDILIASTLDFDRLPNSYSFRVLAHNTFPPYFNDTTMVTVQLTDTNDIHPFLILNQPNITFVENSNTQQIATNIVVTDADSADHPITMCSIVLDREHCYSSREHICQESISLNETRATQLGLIIDVSVEIENQTIIVTGHASEMVYQQVLASLEYANMAQEPNLGVRSVSIQCYDGDFASNILQIFIDIQLINEFCPIIAASQLSFNYTEESGVLEIGNQAGFILSDLDHAPHNTLMQLQITLRNRPDGEDESISVTNIPSLAVSSSDNVGSGVALVLSSLSIMATGPANLSTYNQLLQTLVYENSHTEPTPGLRMIEISPVDSAGDCAKFVLNISITLLNDNPPSLVLVAAADVSYFEGSGDLAFASEAGLTITDADNNQLFLLQSSTITLDGVLDIGMEMLSYDSQLLPSGVTVIRSATSSQIGLQFTGRATVQEYEAALLLLTYNNNATEPTPGNRTVSITVSDGTHEDVTVVIVIVILVDDNPLTIRVGIPQLVYTEGDGSLAVGALSEVALVDIDRDPLIDNLTITLTGSQDQENEFLSINASSITNEVIPNGSVIRLSRRSTLTNYQVRS